VVTSTQVEVHLVTRKEQNMRFYVASSWRNLFQPRVVQLIREASPFDNVVYDFREKGFSWSIIDPDWRHWTPRQYAAALDHAEAIAGHARDMEGLEYADATVLVLPAGRSASWELGYAMASKQECAVYMPEPSEAELMFRGARFLFTEADLKAWASGDT